VPAVADLNIDRRALAALANGPEAQRALREAAIVIRDRARATASTFSTNSDAIEVETGTDGGGIYADIGYLKHHPGFYLWWQEVGTVNHPPRPHLRPAVRPID
jgi:HK97 gp10 family phage protein